MSGILTGFAVIGLAVVVGYIIARIDLLGPHARPVLSRLTFFVLSPFLLFVVLARADVKTLFSALLPVSMITAAIIILGYALVSRFVLRRPTAEATIGALASGYVNAANLGIPVAVLVLGDAATIAPILLLVVLFYFLMIRPQQKRMKEHAALLAGLKRGDNVVLSSGILGKIVRVEDKEVGVEIATGVTVKVIKGMITEVRAKGEPAPANDAKN